MALFLAKYEQMTSLNLHLSIPPKYISKYLHCDFIFLMALFPVKYEQMSTLNLHPSITLEYIKKMPAW